ncbi:MAG TPA: hypothetical protein VF268_15320 [Gammaproteobacteria bacterium]
MNRQLALLIFMVLPSLFNHTAFAQSATIAQAASTIRDGLGDFNGDGRADLFFMSGDASDLRRALFLSSGTGFSAICPDEPNEACGVGNEPFHYNWRARKLLGDFSGDGKTDLLVLSAQPDFLRRVVYNSTSTGTGFNHVCVGQDDGACGFDTEPYMQHPKTVILPGYYNADNRLDLLVVSGDLANRERQLLLSNGAGFTPVCGASHPDGYCNIDSDQYTFHPRTRLLSGDYNGDGRTDLLIVSGDPDFTRRVLYVANASNSFDVACSSEQDGACGLDTEKYSYHPRTRYLTGDYNGDGKTDLLVMSGDEAFSRRILYLANAAGDGFHHVCAGEYDGACGLDTESYTRHPRTRVLRGDFNGDGKTDLLLSSGDSGFPRRILHLANASGNGFEVACVGEQDGACGLDLGAYIHLARTRMLPADYDGDGKTDLLVLSGQSNFLRRVLYRSDGNGFTATCVGESDGACGLDMESYTYHPRTNMPGYDHGHAENLAIGTRFHSPEVLTDALQYHLDKRYGELVLDPGQSTAKYNTGPLFLNHGGTTIRWEPNVTLKAAPGLFPDSHDSMITARAVRDLKFLGAPGAQIQMRKEEYVNSDPSWQTASCDDNPRPDTAEWRSGLSLENVVDVEIADLHIHDTGGDGIYLGNGDFPGVEPYNANIHIHGVTLNNNSRNALTIVSAKNVLVEDSVFANTRSYPDSGIAWCGPWAGIDFEPDKEWERLENVTVRNSQLIDNRWSGLTFALFKLTENSPVPVSIFIEDITETSFWPEADAIQASVASPPVSGTITLTNFQNTNGFHSKWLELVNNNTSLTIVQNE